MPSRGTKFRGCSSTVERLLAKQKVGSPILLIRSGVFGTMKDISRPDDVIAIAHGYIAVDEERGSRPVVAIGRNNTTHRFYCACVLNDDGEVVFAQRKIEPIPATVAQG